MIQLTKLLLLASLFFACNGSQMAGGLNSAEGGGQDSTVVDPGAAAQVYSFYKSYPLCESGIGVFSQEEADELYATRTFNLEGADPQPFDFAADWGEELAVCATEGLGLPPDVTFQLWETDFEFPFDNLYLVGGEFLLALQDGYFFAFARGGDQIATRETTRQGRTLTLPRRWDPAGSDLKNVRLAQSSIKLRDGDFEEAYLAYLPDTKGVTVAILSVCYEIGTCDEFLVTADASGQEVDRLPIYFNEAPDGNVEKYQFATYEIDPSYEIKVTTVNMVENLDSGEVTSRKEKTARYRIGTDGRITAVK